ncbi:methylated-DNA--[protein]-cysteine S-methyltransferase [Candidatus Parcubacteria bacterium]|jgi:O-6-methylguanine DNA methyltransferase|nr:methylated-DNA--[protein]-cysteine S-methyltransferase [Candidatus Parcubacteria bacterium]
MHKAYYKSPIGILEIVANNKGITAISFVKIKSNNSKSNALITRCIVQLKEYFSGQRKTFDVPIVIEGTEWQVRVWTELTKIPFGSIIAYQDLAAMSGNKQAARAVGNAVNKNKIPIIIPCHRVLGSSGKLVGYEGGLWRKKYLLEQEIKYS